MAKSKHKPLSFSTTMRNPERIAGFISHLLPYENKILTNPIIMEIVGSIIKNRLYKPYYVNSSTKIKNEFMDEEIILSDDTITNIINNSPQNHKEAGFDKGWPSRFDTWYKLPMEFGFIFYKIGQPIRISNIGHMLIDAYNEESPNDEKIQMVFLNSMIKYQTNNPFRKNLNSNIPLVLLLNVIKLIKEKYGNDSPGISRKELPLFICYPNNNAEELFNIIFKIREKNGFSYSEEYIYDICLDMLGATEEDKNYYKINQITGELVDEYIRKMRTTAIISLRGGGRFIDFNTVEIEKINYIIDTYKGIKEFKSTYEYYEYIGIIDDKILNISKSTLINLHDLKLQTLTKYASTYTKTEIINEIDIVTKNNESKDQILRYIPKPTRLEFLTSIALVQNYNNLIIVPNYSVDDEGLPVCTASGGKADIECYTTTLNNLIEVTLMIDRTGQVNNEIVPIRRHLLESKKYNPNLFSVFIAPRIHADAKEMACWYKHKDNIDILTFSISEFLSAIKSTTTISELLKIS